MQMAPRTETLLVREARYKERLDAYLHKQFPNLSRGSLRRLIETGDIQLNGRAVKPSHSPRAGDQVEVHWPEAKPASARPENIPLEILFEDADIVVLNKPPGLVVHPSAGHDEHTLVNALLHHCRGQLSGIGGVARPGIVHRLDKDTSGCLVVAKNDAAHLSLAAQFAERKMQKVYEALVCGSFPKREGEIRAAISRHPTHRKRMAVTDGSGRAALTSYRVLEWFHAATYLEAVLHTGRTHQIRVHFHHVGCPLVGDPIYGKRHNQSLLDSTGVAASRQMLHARSLSFHHPVKEQPMTFEAPLPEDFCQTLSALRKG